MRSKDGEALGQYTFSPDISRNWLFVEFFFLKSALSEIFHKSFENDLQIPLQKQKKYL